MHELSVCHGLLTQVAEIAHQAHADQVERIRLRIGPLSGVVPELLKQAFSIARYGTIAANAELVIEALPVRIRCTRCGGETDTVPNRLLCGQCGDFRTQLLSGAELLLASVDLIRATELDYV